MYLGIVPNPPSRIARTALMRSCNCAFNFSILSSALSSSLEVEFNSLATFALSCLICSALVIAFSIGACSASRFSLLGSNRCNLSNSCQLLAKSLLVYCLISLASSSVSAI